MFTWICPKCGTEVPPSYNECPRCAAATSAASQPAQEEPAPPVASPLSQAPPPPPAAAAPQQPFAWAESLPATPESPAHRKFSPVLMAGLTVVALAGLLAVLYFFVLPKRSASAPAKETAELQSPVPASGAAHPLAKHLEVGGVRVIEAGEGAVKIQFLVINHSAADLPDMKMNVTLRAAGKPVFEFPVALPSIGPYESRDLAANVKTDLKPYEIPDWQALRPEFRLATQP